MYMRTLRRIVVALLMTISALITMAFTENKAYMMLPSAAFLTIYAACRLALLDHHDVLEKGKRTGDIKC